MEDKSQIKSTFFTVLAVGDEPRSIVNKYDMSREVEPYVKYRYLDAAKYKKGIEKTLRKLVEDRDKTLLPPTTFVLIEERLKVLEGMSPFEYYRELTDGLYYNENGDALSTENLEGRWLTCREARNFATPFTLIDGTESFQARVRSIDFDATEKGKDVYHRAWELLVDGAEPESDEDEKIIKGADNIPKAYFDNFSSREEYADYCCNFWTYAVVDKNGWSSVDDVDNAMDWVFRFKERFIDPLPEDTLLTIYECTKK